MPGALFDSYLIVDWSAAGVPRTGRESIWVALVSPDHPAPRLENPATRIDAIGLIADLLEREVGADRRILAGFDFPFGYPAGTAERLTGHAAWGPVWETLAGLLEEGPRNANNRFDAAARLNQVIAGGAGPFWANGLKRDIPGLPRKRPDGFGERLPPRNRAAERHVRRAQEVWKLAGAGSVGGQALTGIAALARLRRHRALSDHIRVWPFETRLAEPRAPIVLAEVYPSLFPSDARETVKDAGQVRAVAERFAALDARGRLAALFRGPECLTPEERRAIETEEAWMLGAGFEADIRPAHVRRPADLSGRRPLPPAGGGSRPLPHPSPRPAEGGGGGASRLRYTHDPAEIYRQSFESIRAATRLDHLPESLHKVAIRLVHASGMADVPDRLAWSADVAAAARAALTAGAPVLCDCEMVAAGIVRARLPAGNPVVCTLNDPAVPGLAATIGNTRSAAAVELWRERIGGAVAVIGNAPTALFHLLELLDEGWPRPAAILGFPVGFVGAAESKAALARNPRGVPYLALRGRRGGSAMAAAALNALAAGLQAPR